MSKKNSSMEKFLVGSSLFRNQKSQMHTSYITHSQYFKLMKGEGGTNSHFRYMSDVRHGHQSQIHTTPPQRLFEPQQKSSNLSIERKQQEKDPSKIKKQFEQSYSLTSSNLVKSGQKRPVQTEQIVASNIQNKEKGKDNELHLESKILDEEEPYFLKTISQDIQLSESSRKDRSRYQNYDYSNINIVISPSPQPKAYIGQRQIIDKFTQTNQQPLDYQISPGSKMDSRAKKSQERNKTNSLLRSQASGLSYSKESYQPQESSRRLRTYNYSLMETPNKNIRNQGTRKNQLDEITLTNKRFQPQRSQRLGLLNKQLAYGLQDANRKFSFFMATHRQASNYLDSTELQLKQAYFSLENIQADIDRIIHSNLQLQCQKIRNSLLRIIDSGISRFKDHQTRLLENNKIIFIAELYEIKSNIELRQKQIQNFKLTFQQKRQWKQTVSQLLIPDFEQNVRFLLSKSDQIGSEWLGNTNKFLAKYNRQIVQNMHTTLEKEIKLAFGQAIDRFTLKHMEKVLELEKKSKQSVVKEK